MFDRPIFALVFMSIRATFFTAAEGMLDLVVVVVEVTGGVVGVGVGEG